MKFSKVISIQQSVDNVSFLVFTGILNQKRVCESWSSTTNNARTWKNGRSDFQGQARKGIKFQSSKQSKASTRKAWAKLPAKVRVRWPICSNGSEKNIDFWLHLKEPLILWRYYSTYLYNLFLATWRRQTWCCICFKR